MTRRLMKPNKTQSKRQEKAKKPSQGPLRRERWSKDRPKKREMSQEEMKVQGWKRVQLSQYMPIAGLIADATQFLERVALPLLSQSAPVGAAEGREKEEKVPAHSS